METIEIGLIKTKLEIPQIPENWDYDESVSKVKGFVHKAKNLTQGILGELWIAREMLSREGRPQKTDANASVFTWFSYCEEIGINKSTANRWLNPEPIAHVAQSTGETEWDTPLEFIQSAKQVMGNIDIDPASNEQANERIQANTFYTAKDNGLDKNWHGNVWMNPPYAQPLITKFCKKLVEKYESGKIEQACVLVNNATETTWFQEMLRMCKCVCFPKGRIRFINKEGNPIGAPLQGQAILYFGQNKEGFSQEFSKYGLVLWRK